MTPAAPPDLNVEREFFPSGLVAGLDEVGRGALAGPVTVGVVVLNPDCGPIPTGLADSKLVKPAQRRDLVPHIEAWAEAFAVVHRSPAFIDEWGIVGALASAAREALDLLCEQGVQMHAVIVDGPHNYVGAHPCATLLVPKVKADLHCASVAAASVLAKVARDRLMAELESDFPGYGWASNKGYGSAAHRDAIDRLGVTEWHRRSWNLTLSTSSDVHPQVHQESFFPSS